MIKLKMVDAHLRSAYAYGKTSYAKRLQVGAVIVNRLTDQPVSIGWNGMPSGVPNICEIEVDGKLVTKPEVIHAEVNALTRIPQTVDNMSLTIFVSHSPCINCAKAIVRSGIDQVVFGESYRDDTGVRFLLDNNVEVFRQDDLWLSELYKAGDDIKHRIADVKDGFLYCRHMKQHMSAKPYGLGTHKWSWTLPSKGRVIGWFQEGKSIQFIAEKMDRSYGSICALLQREGLLSWSSRSGFMRTVSSREREVWCSIADLKSNRDAISNSLYKLAPLIETDIQNGLSIGQLEQKYRHVARYHILQFIKSSINGSMVY